MKGIKIKMPSFCINCICLLVLFPLISSVQYPSSKCDRNDCFYELPDFKKNRCKIYNTSVCLDLYQFEGSVEETSEENSKFHVSVVPYTAELFVYPANVIRSAINFTLTINDTDINKLVIKISTQVSSRPICRIFDFQNVNISKKIPINLFYDCLFNMVEHGMQNVQMDFIALPARKKLSYYVFIPGTKYPGSCVWQPLIMVFSGSLQNGEVQVKFSQAPELYNVSFYVVKLTQKLSGGEKIINLTPDINRRMIFAKFSSVGEGMSSVSIKPVIWGLQDNCWATLDVLLIEKTKYNYMLILYLVIFILLIICAIVFLKMFGHNIAKLRFGSKRHILLLYSYDCTEHEDFVKAFIDYLKKYCHVEIFTIYGDESNPLEWIKQKYNDSDIIMYLISAGLFHTLNSKHLQMGHEWRKQLLWSTNFILLELLNNTADVRKKKICKVCFPYSSKEYIPNSLQPGFGKCYDLPKEINNLINFIHDFKDCFLLSKLCVTNFESSRESAVLLEKMGQVQAAVKSNSHIHFIKPLSNTTTNELDFVYHPNKPINLEETSNNSSDENLDYVINFLSGNTPKAISKESFSNLSSSDNICPMLKNGGFIEPNNHEHLSDCEEISALFKNWANS